MIRRIGALVRRCALARAVIAAVALAAAFGATGYTLGHDAGRTAGRTEAHRETERLMGELAHAMAAPVPRPEGGSGADIDAAPSGPESTHPATGDAR